MPTLKSISNIFVIAFIVLSLDSCITEGNSRNSSHRMTEKLIISNYSKSKEYSRRLVLDPRKQSQYSYGPHLQIVSYPLSMLTWETLSLAPDSKQVVFASWFGENHWAVNVDGAGGQKRYLCSGKYCPVFRRGITIWVDKDSYSQDETYYYGTPGPSLGVRYEVSGASHEEFYSALTFSPDSKRLAFYTVSEEGKYRIFMDGEASREYDDISESIFSPNSQHFAYIAKQRGKWMVVVDGIGVGQYDHASSLSFTPDSGQVAFAAKLGNKELMVFGSTEGKKYDLVCYISSPVFSPDSKRFAYIAENGDRKFVIVDGQEYGPYDDADGLTFSLDSTRFAFSTERGGKRIAVVDGLEGREYDYVSIGYPQTFSKDSKHFAYIARINNKELVVSDNMEGNNYDSVSDLQFSQDGSRYLYKAKRGEEGCIVLDGIEQAWYSYVANPLFTRDGKHIIYEAKRGDKWMPVIDGVPGKEYDNIYNMKLCPDGKRVAYIATLDKKQFVVMERLEYTESVGLRRFMRRVTARIHQEGKRYDEIDPYNFRFLPAQEKLAYTAKKGNVYCVVVGGKERGKTSEEIYSLTFSPDGKRVAYGENYGYGKVRVVVDDFRSMDYQSFHPPVFSSDSKHFAYTANRDGKVVLVIDGAEKNVMYDKIMMLQKENIEFDELNRIQFITRREDTIYFVEWTSGSI